MNKRIEKRTEIEKRMLSVNEAIDYCGLGRVKTLEWCKEIGALKKIGRRSLIDKQVVDAALDALEN